MNIRTNYKSDDEFVAPIPFQNQWQVKEYGKYSLYNLKDDHANFDDGYIV
ncbi:MAG: hypothetical protein LBJ13_00495 [Puniceicoccales bacterium]|nr:hypothetical protein [Puniceicoccales bacterium]